MLSDSRVHCGIIGIRWKEEVEAGQIPMVQQPGQEAHLMEWLTECTGELLVAAGKCETLARTLAEPPGS